MGKSRYNLDKIENGIKRFNLDMIENGIRQLYPGQGRNNMSHLIINFKTVSKKRKRGSTSQKMNHKAVCRTAPATSGMLIHRSPDSSYLGSCGAVGEDIPGGSKPICFPDGWRQCTDMSSLGARHEEHKHTGETVLQPSWHSDCLFVCIHTKSMLA